MASFTVPNSGFSESTKTSNRPHSICPHGSHETADSGGAVSFVNKFESVDDEQAPIAIANPKTAAIDGRNFIEGHHIAAEPALLTTSVARRKFATRRDASSQQRLTAQRVQQELA